MHFADTYFKFLKGRIDTGVISRGQDDRLGVIRRTFKLINDLRQLANGAGAIDYLMSLGLGFLRCLSWLGCTSDSSCRQDEVWHEGARVCRALSAS